MYSPINLLKVVMSNLPVNSNLAWPSPANHSTISVSKPRRLAVWALQAWILL
ncbi:hypothetical protein BH10ACT4_BH10ACT4_08100 [soil metagenome]